MDESRALARQSRRLDNVERDIDRLDRRVTNLEDSIEGLEVPAELDVNWAKSAATLLFALSAFVTPIVVAIIAAKGHP